MRVSLQVNGDLHTVDLDDPDMPLLFVLRELLDMKGTKYSCLEGLCGACTVHLDGVAVRSCQMPVSQVADQRITTIEGLSADGSHPVQRAWVERRVPQCGWCQPGQIMQAASFLASAPGPSRQEVVHAMSGNLCRCGTGPRIVDAVLDAAAQTKRAAS